MYCLLCCEKNKMARKVDKEIESMSNQMIYNNRKEIIEKKVNQYISEIFSYWPVKNDYYSLMWLKWSSQLKWNPTISELLQNKKQLENTDNNALRILYSVLNSYTIFLEGLEKYRNDWFNLMLLPVDDIDWAMTEYKEKYYESVEDLVPRILEIFINTEWTRDTWFLYQNAWIGLYNQIENEPSYSAIIQEWTSIIKKHKKEIRKLLPNQTILVDFWCCDWKKAWALLDGIRQNITYLPVDVNEELLNNSKTLIEKLENNNCTTKKIKIKTWIINSWKITNPIQSIFGDKINNYTYFFTWWSIWNYDDSTIKILLSETFKPQNWGLVLDYYKAPSSIEEIESLLKCYYNEETKNRFKSWLKNLQLAKNYWETGTKRWNHIGTNLSIGMNFDDFFSFSVRYEFDDISWTKYYAELDENNKIQIYKNNWSWPIKQSILPKQLYPWKIVEWFKVIKDTSNTHWIQNPNRNGEPNQLYLLSEQQIAFYIHGKNLFSYFKNKYFQYDDQNWYHWLVPNDYLKNPENYINEHIHDYMRYRERDEYNDGNIYRFIPKNLDYELKKMWQIFPVENNVDWGRCVPISRKKWEFIPIEISRRFSDEQIKYFLVEAGWPKEKINIISWKEEKFMKLVVASV